ncbi:muconolactone Delta-isomerase [Pseudomonas sp. HR1]|uniref:muconolactone Delta-isomerase n=2 Tax=Pseudomonas TaxID=286 RepID=UPI0011A6A4EB|nr:MULTISPECIES: muconolactone Delta-isomerase [Pseudomonas]MDK4201846.1 muconolactone Delta-isomerase [Pseudomonas sp. HR1]MDU4059420.1 muconolactone Delta-isomerase [Pseudomonas oryzihabitans]
MLFMVRMTVKLPHDLPAADATRLKQAEKELAQELQRQGTWRHLWRIAGLYANVSIFDAADTQALHDTLLQLPLYPYMEIEVTALCRHPSSIHTDDR